MSRLESRVPPPFVMLAVGLLMWTAATLTPFLRFPVAIPAAGAAALALVGLLIEGAGALSFLRARTTVDSTHPGAASTLVVAGVHRFTRNPMYLGDLLLLLGFGLYLSNPLALALAWIFVPYIDRFQILPEERAMSELFGERYADYRSRVRRWL